MTKIYWKAHFGILRGGWLPAALGRVLGSHTTESTKQEEKRRCWGAGHAPWASVTVTGKTLPLSILLENSESFLPEKAQWTEHPQERVIYWMVSCHLFVLQQKHGLDREPRIRKLWWDRQRLRNLGTSQWGDDLELVLMIIACAPCLPASPLHRISSLDPQSLLGAYFLCVLFIPFIFTDEKLRNMEIKYLPQSHQASKCGNQDCKLLSLRIISCLVWLQEPKSSQFLFLHLWAPRDGEAGWALWSLLSVPRPSPQQVSTAMNWTVGYGVPSGKTNPSIFHRAHLMPPKLASPPFPLSVKIDSPLFACLWNLHICPAAILGSPFPYTKPLSSYANSQVLLIKVPHLRGRWRDNTSWKIIETHFFVFEYFQDFVLAADQLWV